MNSETKIPLNPAKNKRPRLWLHRAVLFAYAFAAFGVFFALQAAPQAQAAAGDNDIFLNSSNDGKMTITNMPDPVVTEKGINFNLSFDGKDFMGGYNSTTDAPFGSTSQSFYCFTPNADVFNKNRPCSADSERMDSKGSNPNKSQFTYQNHIDIVKTGTGTRVQASPYAALTLPNSIVGTATSGYLTVELVFTIEMPSIGEGPAPAPTINHFFGQAKINVKKIDANQLVPIANPGASNINNSTQSYSFTSRLGDQNLSAVPTGAHLKWFWVTDITGSSGAQEINYASTAGVVDSTDNKVAWTDPQVDTKKNSFVMLAAVDGNGNVDESKYKKGVLSMAVATNNAQLTAANQTTCSTLQDFPCLIGSVVATLALIIRNFIWYAVVIAILPIMKTILAMQPHNTDFAAIILEGWVTIRNLMNIVFILGLIVTALATLFRVSKTNYKQVIASIFMMALLVNFSLVIAQVVLGIADTAQAQFLPNNSVVIDRFAKDLIVGPDAVQYNSVFAQAGTFSGVITSLFTILFALGAAAALGALTVFLIIRVVALWLLLMTSPIAYAFNVFPQTKSYATKWWNEFVKYAFFTPLIALGLHICLIIVTAQRNYVATMATSAFYTAPSGDFAQFIYNVLSNFLEIVCLFAVLQIARNMGVAGANKITGTAENFVKKPAAKIGAGARKLGGMAGAAANLHAVQRPRLALTNKLLTNKDGSARTGATAGLSRFAAKWVLNPGEAWKQNKSKPFEEKQKDTEAKRVAAISSSAEFMRSGQGRDPREVAHMKTAADDKNKAMFAGWGLADRVGWMKNKGSDEKFLSTAQGAKEMHAFLTSTIEEGHFKDFTDALIEQDVGGKFTNLKTQGKKYDNLGPEGIRDVVKTLVGDTKEGNLFMKYTMDDLGKKKGRYEYRYMGEDKFIAKDGKEYKDEEARAQKRAAEIEDATDEMMAKFNPSALLMMGPDGKPTPEAKALIKRTERLIQNGKEVNRNIYTTIGASYHDAESRLLFETKEKADFFDYAYKESSVVGNAVVNLVNHTTGRQLSRGWAGAIVPGVKTGNLEGAVLLEGDSSGDSNFRKGTTERLTKDNITRAGVSLKLKDPRTSQTQKVGNSYLYEGVPPETETEDQDEEEEPSHT